MGKVNFAIRKQNGSNRWRGVTYALAAAILFGASTPLAKQLLPGVEPLLMAGLLYFGSGIGLLIYRLVLGARASRETPVTRSMASWLAAAIICGGVIAPFLLMLGLRITPASSASLMLNLEGVLTALLAWFVFHENYDGRVALGMGLITVGALTLSWMGRPEIGPPWGALAIAGACLAWAADNNFTRKVSGADPLNTALLKGLCAGGVNTLLAVFLGARLPNIGVAGAIGIVGFLGYGVSLTLFVLSLRHLGAARTGAYFSIAPFIGAAISIPWLGEPLTPGFSLAAILMGSGLWLHLTESHEHFHRHEAMQHDHAHLHDEHHQHDHQGELHLPEQHSHPHRHEPIVHRHHHYPDTHHGHRHE
jgi:drug/metabolite transporter (DMT)-like permease